MTRLQIWFLVIISCFASVWAFNLDVDHLVKYRGRPGSMFGFTVAQHSYRTQNWIIVGAPEDRTSQVGVTRGGAVYRCNATGDSCEQIIFDRNGDNKDQDGNHIDSKSNQWFGATLTSSNGSVLACAPRYVYTQPTSAEERRDPVGTCWLAKDQLNKAQEFSPCRNRDWGYHRHGHCQAGLGAALSKDGGRLYIGAPGSCFWQGQVHSVAATTKLPFVPPKVIIIDEKGKIHSQNTHNRADVISSSDGPYTDDDSYLGYSVTSGRFDGGLEAPAPSDIAVGVPKGERLNGKVVLFTYNMTHIRNITGEQLGAYFGYAMAACDIDDDGFDDLIVGAPMYTEEGNDEGFYETGRIYVFYAGHSDDKHIRDGDKNNRARFGHSIACLGDVNSDGYNDFAVGAPYGKDGERGAVYIYHGSRTGVREKYSQVIRAEEIPGNPLTFGFSVAGGIDMDRNEYPDLSVGAYESDQAFLFKARPVVEMHSTVTFDSESKQISLEEQNCTLKDRTRVPCVKLDACLRYEGLGVDSRLPFEIQVLLDARKPKSPRLAFLSEEGRNALNQTTWLEKGRTFCSSYWVYLKTNIRDKLTSLDAELWYSLINNQNARAARSLTPVLNANENLSAKDTLTIQKNCGRDNICIPDLRLIARPSVEKYVLGSGKRMEIEVEVQNEGEDAFETTFELQVPSGLNYVKIERKDESEREIPVQCSPPSFNNNYTLHCDIGNPLPREKLVRFLVLLQPYHQKTMNSTYDFSMVVNSTNPERNRTVSDNFIHFAVPIWVVTELAISGSSRPVDVYFNSSQYVTDDETKITKESQIGPQVAHLYTITNRGPSEFLKAKATILWPSNTLTGEPLLYLLEEPETSGDIKCRVEDDEYNVKKVKIERKGKSFFDAEAGSASAWHSSDYESGSESSSSSGGGSSTKTTSSSSSSSWSSSSSSGSRAHLSREERLQFEAEERRREEEAAARETGDGSHRHGERAKATHHGKNHFSSNGGRLESDSYSSGSEDRGRDRTEYSRVPVDGSRVREEEHRTYSSSSWSGRGPPVTRTKSSERTSTTRDGKTETKWRVEEDGVVRSGSNVVDNDGNRRGGPGGIPIGAVERNYEMNSTRSSGSRTRGGGSGNADRRVSWRVEGGGADGTAGTGGTRTAEETRTEWNTTWSSGGRPITSEHTSWRKEQDGAVVGSTEHSRTYEGDYEASRTGASRVSGFEDRASSSGRRVGWRAEDEGRTRESTGTVLVDEGRSGTTSRRRGQSGAAGTRTSEERRSEWTRVEGSSVLDEGAMGAASRNRGQGGAGGSRTSEERRFEWTRENGGAAVEGTSGTGSRRYGQGGVAGTRTSEDRRSEWTRVDGSTATVDEHSSRAASGSHGQGGARTSEERRFEWTRENGGTVAIDEGTSVTGSRRHGHGGSAGTRTSDESGTAVVDESTSGIASRNRGRDGVVGTRTSEERRTEWTRENGGTVFVDEGTSGASSRRRGPGGAGGTRTAEERRSEWNTTWSSGGRPVTSEHSSWKKEQDGAVVGSGDHSRTYEGEHTGTSRNTVHEDNSSSSHRNVNWRVEGEGMTREGGTVVVDDSKLEVSSGRKGHGEGHAGVAGSRTSEEKRSEWNTTWSSGGRPVTSEHTSWRKEQDGTVVGSGDHTRTYEGTAERAKAEIERRLREQLNRRISSTVASTHSSSGSADSEIDQNLIAGGGGGTTYKKEWEEHYNTTWGTSTGGKPVTVAKTKWTIEEDGTVKTGGDTKTYEGVPPGTAGTTLTFPSGTSLGEGRGQGSGISRASKHHEASHHESRTHTSGGVSGLDTSGTMEQTETSHSSEVSRSGSTHTGGSERRHHFSTESEDIDVRAGERTGESERRTYHAGDSSSGSSSSRGHHHRAESSFSEAERTAQGHRRGGAHTDSERRTHAEDGTLDTEHRAHGHRSEVESGRRTHSHESDSGSGFTEAERRSQSHRAGESHHGSERRTHGSGSSVAATVGESSGASSSFDFGAVARGPGDGKARTHVTDLGILDSGASSGSSAVAGSRTVHFGAAEVGGSRRHHSGSRERHYTFGSDGDVGDEEIDTYDSFAHGSGERSSAGSAYNEEARYSSGRSHSRNVGRDPGLDTDYESRRAGSSSASSHSYSRSSSSRGGTYEAGVSDEDRHIISDQNDRHEDRRYRRERREADDYDSYSYDEYEEEEEAGRKCTGPVKCTRIVCDIGALKKDQEVHVAIRSRLWLATIKKIAPHVETVVGSEMTAKVTLLPTIGRPSHKTMTKNSTEVKTRIMTEPLSQPDVVPLWIVVLSAVSGALILMLLVYILYKLGFFKRNRPEPSTGSEKTPLNRNGHYQGDEPL